MAKTKESVLRQLEENYEKACNAWVVELARLWGMGNIARGNWIGDDVGGVFDFDGAWMLSMRDIQYIVRKGITLEQAADWQDYASWITDYEKFGYEVPTLREYVEYLVPLLDQEARQRLDKGRQHIEDLKDELFRLCDEELEKARTQFLDRLNMRRHIDD